MRSALDFDGTIFVLFVHSSHLNRDDSFLDITKKVKLVPKPIVYHWVFNLIARIVKNQFAHNEATFGFHSNSSHIMKPRSDFIRTFNLGLVLNANYTVLHTLRDDILSVFLFNHFQMWFAILQNSLQQI